MTQKIKVGSVVTLIDLPDWMVLDLPEDEQKELRAFVGTTSVVYDIDAYGYPSICSRFVEQREDGVYHGGPGFSASLESLQVCPLGTFGYYTVDVPRAYRYGLFMELLGMPVFIGIKEDEFFEQRKQQAMRLFDAQKELGINLADFFNKNPKYKTREILYIGLSARNLEEGEVLWSFGNDPGDNSVGEYRHSLLYGFNFVCE
jgi:hypothetical protein